MKLTKRQLQRALNDLTRAHNMAVLARAQIAEHCMEVYGVDPADVDNDEFIDAVGDGGGMAMGMTVAAFDASMRRCLGDANHG